MQATRAANDTPIPGYRLVDRLGVGGFGEVWRCEAPGGLLKAIKFVSGTRVLERPASNAEKELRALHLIKSINHPYLLSIERIETLPDGDLAIVSELAECSLHDLLEQRRQEGQIGLPRGEALAYLHEAAEALDLINQEHGLQHLDIKPRNLFLVRRHIKVGDFGLVFSLADLFGGEGKERLSGVTPLYAAPEVFAERVTLHTDQFSLAVTYHELVTGDVVFKGKNLCAQIFLVSASEPDLSRLIEPDRAVVARALSKDPRERFPSCTEFVEALLEAAPPASGRFLRGRTSSFNLPPGDATLPARQSVSAPVSRVAVASPVAAPTPPATAARAPAHAGPEAGAVLPGLQLLECLQRGNQGEWWRATGPRGEPRLIRFLSEGPAECTNEELTAQLLALNHPNLAHLKAVPAGPGRLALVSEAGGASLYSQVRDAQGRGQPGLPREEALTLLAEAARALDELHEQFGMQHLLLTPRHIALQAGSVRLFEYGLGELCWAPRGHSLAELNPRYGAAELLRGEISPAADQSSLALMYPEMILGLHPYRNLNARQMIAARRRGEPDLSLLPGPERLPLLRALSDAPERRFASCAELVEALYEATLRSDRGTVSVPVALTDTQPRNGGTESAPRGSGMWPGQGGLAPEVSMLDDLLAQAARGHEVRSPGLLHYRIAAGHSIEYRCRARLAPGMARLKLSGLRERWQADVLQPGPAQTVLFIRGRGSIWGRWFGRSPGLQVEITFGAIQEELTPIRALITPQDCSGPQALEMLGELGVTVLGSLQTYLSSQSTRADQERFPLNQEIFVQSPGTGQEFSARLRDIGRAALAFYAPYPIPAGNLAITLRRPQSVETFTLTGRARDCWPCEPRDEKGELKYEVEVRLSG